MRAAPENVRSSTLAVTRGLASRPMAGPTPAAASSVRRPQLLRGRVSRAKHPPRHALQDAVFPSRARRPPKGASTREPWAGSGMRVVLQRTSHACHSRGTTAASSMLLNGSTQNIGCRVRSSGPRQRAAGRRSDLDPVDVRVRGTAKASCRPHRDDHVVIEIHAGWRLQCCPEAASPPPERYSRPKYRHNVEPLRAVADDRDIRARPPRGRTSLRRVNGTGSGVARPDPTDNRHPAR